MAIDSRYTHKGWFWFVPIYMSDPDSSEPMAVETRHEWMEPLFTVAEWFEMARIWVMSAIYADYEPTFMFSVTGHINRGANS